MVRPSWIRTACLAAAGFAFTAGAAAQADDICRDAGESARESNRQGRLIPVLYGRIAVEGIAPDVKAPRVTAIYSDSLQPGVRQVIDRKGSYCFKRLGNGGVIIIDVDGVEAARKTISDLGPPRQQEDFEIDLAKSDPQMAPPGVISTKFTRPPNEKTVDLYKKAAAAERDKKPNRAIDAVKEVVAIDPDDFIAWAKLGSLYMEKRSLEDAEKAFFRALTIRRDYTTALMNLGILRAVQARYPEAIELFKQAIATDQTSARAYRLLGEAYLQNRNGSLGLAALDQALKLDPVGMAECHLLKARLYDLAGAKGLAAHEYKAYLEKVPETPDKKRLEEYIRANPE